MRYEDVDADEAVDLIDTLPQGSLWRTRLFPQDKWDDLTYIVAKIADYADIMARGMRIKDTTPTPVERPLEAKMRMDAPRATEAAKAKAREVSRRLREGKWKEVDADG